MLTESTSSIYQSPQLLFLFRTDACLHLKSKQYINYAAARRGRYEAGNQS